nr:hypothetical protein [uncultured Schaedlerella sp.]
MKKLHENVQRKVNGGGSLHYHWFCSLNNFRSAAYYDYNECLRKKAEHEVKYGHTPYMSIMNCTGDNCRFA